MELRPDGGQDLAFADWSAIVLESAPLFNKVVQRRPEFAPASQRKSPFVANMSEVASLGARTSP